MSRGRGLPAAYPAEVLGRIAALAEADPQREVCGFVVRGGSAAELDVVPVRNVLGEAEAPSGLPASARCGFLVDPAAQLRLFVDLRRGGGEVVACYHSHVDGPAVLSGVDREQALLDGSPALPGAEQLVVAVRGGVAQQIARFRWNGEVFESEPLVRAAHAAAARRAL